jgi:hypothetical protein
LCSAQSRANQFYEDPKLFSGTGFSSSSEEFSSPVPNAKQMNPNHQFSPTRGIPPLNPRRAFARNQYASSPQLNLQQQQQQQPGGRYAFNPSWRRDPMGNIFILPRQLDVGLCQGCKNIYGAQAQEFTQHHIQHHPQQVQVRLCCAIQEYM